MKNNQNISRLEDKEAEIAINDKSNNDFMGIAGECFMEGWRSNKDLTPSQVAKENDKDRYY